MRNYNDPSRRSRGVAPVNVDWEAAFQKAAHGGGYAPRPAPRPRPRPRPRPTGYARQARPTGQVRQVRPTRQARPVQQARQATSIRSLRGYDLSGYGMHQSGLRRDGRKLSPMNTSPLDKPQDPKKVIVFIAIVVVGLFFLARGNQPKIELNV